MFFYLLNFKYIILGFIYQCKRTMTPGTGASDETGDDKPIGPGNAEESENTEGLIEPREELTED